MYIGVAKRNSSSFCSECGGNMRFAVPASARNLTLLAAHFISFAAFLGITLMLSNGLVWLAAIFLFWLAASAMLRRLYVSVLVCQGCGAMQEKI
jgi:hypothetical protein